MREIRPGKINGVLKAPASKSMMIRAAAAAALARGASEISNPSFCDDALSAIQCAKALGAYVEMHGEHVTIVGGGKPKVSALECGESGLCIRMFAPIAALQEKEMVLKASGSMMKRDVGLIQEPLEKLGVRCSTSGGLPPVKVRGPLKGGKISIDGSKSSQLLTGLLMALPLCKRKSLVSVTGLRSKPYVMMTMQLLKEFGIIVRANMLLTEFEVDGGQHYRPAKYEVEGDYSGAAFLLVAGAIAGKVRVEGLKQESLQADRRIVDALEMAGARVMQSANAVEVENGELAGFEFDATDCPDLFPPLAVLAACSNGKSRLKGALRLAGKESDRAATLASELGKMGAKITVDGDVMVVEGGKLKGGEVDSHGDHRIAMACAVAGLAAEKGATIKNPECVSKSYPQFFGDLESLRL